MRLAKTIFIAVLLSTMLTGCGLIGNSNNKTTTTTKDYESSDFKVNIPPEWEVIEKKDFTADVPEVTQVVFRNNVKNETYTANVNVIRNQLQDTIDTSEYAKMVYNRQKTGLYDFKEIRRDAIKLKRGSDDIETTLLVFEARKGTDQLNVRYYQSYLVKNNFAYIITGSASPKENDVTFQTIENTVKSFQVK